MSQEIESASPQASRAKPNWVKIQPPPVPSREVPTWVARNPTEQELDDWEEQVEEYRSVRADWEKRTEAYRLDLARRMASLMDRYGCEPSAVGWRDLALQLALGHDFRKREWYRQQVSGEIAALLEGPEKGGSENDWKRFALTLAIRHEEPEFEIARPPAHRKPKEDEQHRRSEMIECHLPSDISPRGRWQDWGEGYTLKKCESVEEAAKLVAGYLEIQPRLTPRGQSKPWLNLENQYSKHLKLLGADGTRPLPRYLEIHVIKSNVFRCLLAVPVHMIESHRKRQKIS